MRRALVAAALVLACGTASAATLTLARDSYAQIRARHAGRPLVVHIWGMSCGPCLVELPNWAALGRRRPDLDLVLIQADVSPPRAAEQTLARAGLGRYESWRAAGEVDDFVRASIDPAWGGEMPRTLLVGADGATTVVPGIADLAAVTRWLDRAALRR